MISFKTYYKNFMSLVSTFILLRIIIDMYTILKFYLIEYKKILGFINKTIKVSF